jgi:type III pantothenate kinase
MLLAIDVGNTHIAVGLYDGEDLKTHWRMSTVLESTEDETWILMKSICESHGYDTAAIDGVAISSVVPDKTPVFSSMSEKYLKNEPLVVSYKLDLGLQIRYRHPGSVGADRLCNAVGGFFKYGGPLIVVDFGTATTLDVISQQGEYLGGIIAPGIELTASLLHRRAAKLPRVDIQFPDSVIGRSTEASIQSGLMFGAVEMLDGLIRRIGEELSTEVKTVATGGLAAVLIDRLKHVETIDPFLTLDGLCRIFWRIKRKKTETPH